MNIFKNTALTLLLALSFGSVSIMANAAETAKSSVSGPHEVIAHIVGAKAEIMHRDFIPPSEHIKKARAASNKVAGNPDIVKKAHACIIQAQIKVNKGDKQGATDDLNKALALYESLNKER